MNSVGNVELIEPQPIQTNSVFSIILTLIKIILVIGILFFILFEINKQTNNSIVNFFNQLFKKSSTKSSSQSTSQSTNTSTTPITNWMSHISNKLNLYKKEIYKESFSNLTESSNYIVQQPQPNDSTSNVQNKKLGNQWSQYDNAYTGKLY